MPKLVLPNLPRLPWRLQRFLACALPLCALSLAVQQLALAQRPSNALPPPSEVGPTDEYYRGEAPYPTATPNAMAMATATATTTPRFEGTPMPEGTPQSYQLYPGATPPPVPGVPNAEDGSLEAFLGSEAGSIKLSQARRGWKSMRLVRDAAGSAGALAGAVASTSNTGGEPRESDPFYRDMKEKFGGAPDVFLTRGRTLKLNGDDHILVYQAQFPAWREAQKWFEARLPRSASSGANVTAAQVKKITRDFLDTVPLRASLVNTRHIAAMEAIEPFDFQTRLAAFGRVIEDEVAKTSPRQPRAPQGPTDVPPARIPTPRPDASGGTLGPGDAPRVVPVPDAVAQAASTEPLRRLFAAVQRYRADNGDVLPPMEDLAQAQAALSIYLSGGDSWRDPVSDRFFLPNARLSQRRMVHLKPFAQSLILFYSEPDAGGQRMVVRLDGIIRRVSASEWDKLIGTAGVQ